jgi:hypothetical protein
MSHKHKVKTHHWEGGVLSIIEHFFESVEEALLFANHVDSHEAKVYNHNHEIVHHVQPTGVPDQANQREAYA